MELGWGALLNQVSDSWTIGTSPPAYKVKPISWILICWPSLIFCTWYPCPKLPKGREQIHFNSASSERDSQPASDAISPLFIQNRNNNCHLTKAQSVNPCFPQLQFQLASAKWKFLCPQLSWFNSPRATVFCDARVVGTSQVICK